MRPEILNYFFQNITCLKGVGPKTAGWLKLLCGERVLDLLFHLPSGLRHRHFVDGKIPPLNELSIFSFTPKKYLIPPRKKMPFRVLGEASFGLVELVFFRYHKEEIQDRFPLGKPLCISGILQSKNGLLTMVHPDYVRDKKEEVPEHEVIYPLTKGAQNTVLVKLIQQAIDGIPSLPEWQDEKNIKSNQWQNFKGSLVGIHSPKSEADLSLYSTHRMRLAYDELLANQLALMLVRQKNRHQHGISCPCQNKLKLDLPFKLTSAQQKVIEEIREDLASEYCMCRLLQGDVGSGKTIVAVLTALQVLENDGQVALMAPTDILARQHFQKIEKLLAPLGITVALLTAQERGKKRAALLSDLKNGKISFLIGTHALIEEGVQFKNLSYVIIDEQHRFGVTQRLKLSQKQKGVNLLVMTATPIPRSLAMTIYGDMDISLLNEKPAGRTPIITRTVSNKKIPELIQKLTEWPQQVYWVCPLVDESEKSDLMAVKERFNALEEVFGSAVGLVHGKMKAAEKEAVMADFLTGKIKILVSTTVIEVGVDVPNASLMIVEHAERFGLATLHQLRGRVGRGSIQSVCLLLYGKLSETGKERLELLRSTEDGFKIAEADLQMRGAGEILGWQQSGFQNFQLAHLPEHNDLLKQATQEAKEILKNDATLATERGKNLQTLLYLFQKDASIHTLKAG